jgi:hypothetical protein
MEAGRHHASQPTFVELVRGILNDAKELLVEGATLTKLEVQDEIGKAKIAAFQVGIGIGIVAGGGMFLMLTAVYLLDAFTEIPLWGCYGIVGGALMAGGGILLAAGKRAAA